MALFRVDYSGRGELSERQQKVGLRQLFDYAKELNIMVGLPVSSGGSLI